MQVTPEGQGGVLWHLGSGFKSPGESIEGPTCPSGIAAGESFQGQVDELPQSSLEEPPAKRTQDTHQDCALRSRLRSRLIPIAVRASASLTVNVGGITSRVGQSRKSISIGLGGGWTRNFPACGGSGRLGRGYLGLMHYIRPTRLEISSNWRDLIQVFRCSRFING